jgi:hypothetical protein
VNLQQVFNILTLQQQSIAVSFPDKKAYESLRVSLVRKFSGFSEVCSTAGLETYEDQYLQAEWNDADKVGTFALKPKSESKRVKKDYLVKTL